jgi:hypothetical protein
VVEICTRWPFRRTTHGEKVVNTRSHTRCESYCFTLTRWSWRHHSLTPPPQPQISQMSKGAHSHLRWSIFGMTWDFLQLLAYALYSHYFPWHDMPNMRWLVTFLLFVNPTSAALQVAPLAAAVLLFVACAWITATIVAAVWSAHSFSVGDFSTVLPLKFLRATGGLTVVLFVPVVGLLVRYCVQCLRIYGGL